MITKLVFLFGLFATIAYGATITLQDPNCTDFAIGGSAGSRTLSCVSGPNSNPTPPPPAPAPVAVSCAGFDKVIYYKWDWALQIPPLDTVSMKATNGTSGLGTNGILVVEFTPTLPVNTGVGTDPFPYTSQITVTPYPGTSVVNPTTLAISTIPCDLNPPAPGMVIGSSANLLYGIGPVRISAFTGKPSMISLTPGVKYYINVAGRLNGQPTCFPTGDRICDVRLSLFKPKDH